MKKILVPCDFSVPAVEAFKFAVKLAKESDVHVHVLHVIDMTFLHGNPSLSHSFAFNFNFLHEMEKEADTAFQKIWERYATLTLPVTFEHRVGSLLADIQKEVTEKSFDLVMMGISGSHGAVMGSNTEKVIRNISVPVLVISKVPEKPITDIVFPAPLQQTGKKFIEELKKIQNFFGARLHVLWINTPGTFKTDSESHAALQEFVSRFTIENYSINIRSDYNVTDGILTFAKDVDAQMIAMGTHQRKGLAHFFIGSNTEHTANHVDRLLWSYPIR